MKTLKHILIIMVAVAINGNLFCQVCQMIPDHRIITEAPMMDKILNEPKDMLEIKYTISNASSINNKYVHDNNMDIENWMIDPDNWNVNKSNSSKEVLFIDDIEPEINLEEWMLHEFTVQTIN